MTKIVTLATLAESTTQEVFNHVLAHARKQQAKSLTKQGDCAYRGECGLACFAGALMTDSEHKEIVAGNGLNGVTWKGLIKENLVSTSHEELIGDLQGIHDCCSVAHWESHFAKVASVHGLVYEALGEQQ